LQHYVDLAATVVVTHNRYDAYVCLQGECVMVPASHASVIDPTGAGDVFASALFVRYRETGDLTASAHFAHAAAACNIEGQGISAIPTRETVGRKLGIIA
jgi:sugar/nucleoside kinase (ribokinase family)